MWLVAVLLPALVLGQKQPPLDPTAMAQNVDNFRRLYGIAQRIMELSGSFMGQNGGGSGGAFDGAMPAAFRSSGVRNFESDNMVTGGGDGGSEFGRLREDFGLLRFLSTAPPTTTTPKPQPTGIQGLLNTFFGSSVDEAEALPPPPTPRPRPAQNLFGLLGGPPPQQQQSQSSSNVGKINLWELFGVTQRPTTTTQAPLQSLLNPQLAGGSAQNIDAVLNALMRGGGGGGGGGAQQERSQPSSANIFSQFFGRR